MLHWYPVDLPCICPREGPASSRYRFCWPYIRKNTATWATAVRFLFLLRFWLLRSDWQDPVFYWYRSRPHRRHRLRQALSWSPPVVRVREIPAAGGWPLYWHSHWSWHSVRWPWIPSEGPWPAGQAVWWSSIPSGIRIFPIFGYSMMTRSDPRALKGLRLRRLHPGSLQGK